MNRHRLKDVSSALAVIALALVLLLIYQIVRPLGDSEAEPAATATGPSRFPDLRMGLRSKIENTMYDQIVQRNLFSSDREPPTGRPETVTSMGNGEGVTSYEGYELIGTVLAGDEQSFALIRKGGVRGEIESYRLRENFDGLEIQDILYDRIVLSKGGKEVVLLLEPREEERKAARPVPRTRQTNRRTQPGPANTPNPQQTWTAKKRKGQ